MCFYPEEIPADHPASLAECTGYDFLSLKNKILVLQEYREMKGACHYRSKDCHVSGQQGSWPFQLLLGFGPLVARYTAGSIPASASNLVF